MKKFLALLLALVMVFALAACGSEPAEESEAPAAESEEPAATESEAPAEEPTEEKPSEEPAEAVDPNDIEDNITSEDGTYEVAFVTDVGQLHDKSFNEGTWNGVKLYAYENGLTYKYYQPANGDQATDDDRTKAMQDAVDNGAKIVVCAGFLQEAALRTSATNNPDVKFVFIDGYSMRDPIRGWQRPHQRRRHQLPGRAGRLPGRLRHRPRGLHPARLLRRRRRHQPGLLPLRLRLPPGRQRGCRGDGR